MVLYYRNNIYGIKGLVSVNVIYSLSREKYPEAFWVEN